MFFCYAGFLKGRLLFSLCCLCFLLQFTCKTACTCVCPCWHVVCLQMWSVWIRGGEVQMSCLPGPLLQVRSLFKEMQLFYWQINTSWGDTQQHNYYFMCFCLFFIHVRGWTCCTFSQSQLFRIELAYYPPFFMWQDLIHRVWFIDTCLNSLKCHFAHSYWWYW